MSRKQRLVLVASILGSFVAFLDIAIVNVALPAIRRELGGGIALQQWVVDAYLLALGSLILTAGSLSDLFGRKRVFAGGLIGFAATSALCAAAPSVQILIVARGLQGVAGALLVPSSLALIIASFEGPAQGKAIGTWTAWTGISFVLGPLAGGALVDAGSWRWVFAINVVPVAATLAVLARVEPEARPTKRTPVDLVGAGLCAVGLGGVIFALIEGPTRGWSTPSIYLPLAGGAAVFGAFLKLERAMKHPMLDFTLFRSRNFAAGNLATVAIYAGLTASTFLLTVFLQQVAGYSAMAAGLALLPVTVIMFVLSPIFGRLAARHGPRLFMTAGPLAAAAGFALMTRVDARATYFAQLLPGVLVFGLGLAATVAPLTAAVLGGIDQRHAGIGSAINNAIARVAGLLAIAAIGALVASRFAATIDHAMAEPHSFDAPARAFLEEARKRPLDTSVPEPGARGERIAPLKSTLEAASVAALHAGLWSMATLLALGGLISAAGIRNPKAPPPSSV
ncbi:MAG: family efflux transporter permease subunit [Myxococcales bacterium]|nr:family efflux transporter permease subunit [Myxococcales bacterium]